ncbi:MAG: PadR family transcriptional regulator [Roseiflexus sp.]
MSNIRHPLTVEFALLGFVRQQPMHPYELYQRLCSDSALGEVWRIKQAHLYALLHRLEHEGYLMSTTTPQGNRPPRRILSITERGRATFIEWMGTPVVRGRDFRIEFLAKLYFAYQESTATAQDLIVKQLRICKNILNNLDRQAAAIEPDQPYRRLVAQFRRGQIQATLSWLETCAEMLALVED